jgi:hypothetical protein
MKLTSGIGSILALTVRAVAAFFVIFNAIFTDVGSAGERLITFLLVVVVYGTLGGTFGAAAPGSAWKWAIWINLPAIVLVAWYSAREPQQIPLHLAYLALSLGAAWLGAYAGAQLRSRGRSRLDRR